MELGPWSNAYTGKDQYCDTDIVYKLDGFSMEIKDKDLEFIIR